MIGISDEGLNQEGTWYWDYDHWYARHWFDNNAHRR